MHFNHDMKEKVMYTVQCNRRKKQKISSIHMNQGMSIIKINKTIQSYQFERAVYQMQTPPGHPQ